MNANQAAIRLAHQFYGRTWQPTAEEEQATCPHCGSKSWQKQPYSTALCLSCERTATWAEWVKAGEAPLDAWQLDILAREADDAERSRTEMDALRS